MNKINCIVFFLMSFLYLEANGSHSSLNWNELSVSKGRVKDYLRQCEFLPSLETMKKELQDQIRSLVELERLVEDNREPYIAFPPKYDHSLWNSLKSNDVEYIDIDGFRMKKTSALELEILLELTSDNISYLFDSKYLIRVAVENKILFINRRCSRKACIANAEMNLNSIYNLYSVKNDPPLCTSLLCASERIFGYPKNIYLTYAASKYKVNLSKYSDVDADSEGLDLYHLEMILVALDSIPKHLQEEVLMGRSFFRFRKGYFDKYSNSNTLANASGALFDNFFKHKWPAKFYTLVHEIGHWAELYKRFKREDILSRSDEWLAISGFSEVKSENDENLKAYVKRQGKVSISFYGNSSPYEDFAESYTMYRFDPKRMKAKFPKRYNFMLHNLFDGLEYTENLCEGIKK